MDKVHPDAHSRNMEETLHSDVIRMCKGIETNKLFLIKFFIEKIKMNE